MHRPLRFIADPAHKCTDPHDSSQTQCINAQTPHDALPLQRLRHTIFLFSFFLSLLLLVLALVFFFSLFFFSCLLHSLTRSVSSPSLQAGHIQQLVVVVVMWWWWAPWKRQRQPPSLPGVDLEDKSYGRPPWIFRGTVAYQLYLIPSEEARRFVPPELRLVSLAG